MVIPAREFLAKTLLAVTAASRGHQVLVGALPKLVPAFPPGLYHTNDLGRRKASQLGKLRQAGFAITAQDEEHGLTEQSLDNVIATRFHHSTLTHVDASFSWGNWDNQALVQAFPQFSKRFEKTGSPRVDFWRQDVVLAKFVDSRAQRLLNDRPIILFISHAGPTPTPPWITVGHSRGSQLDHDFATRMDRFERLVGYQRTTAALVRAIDAVSEKFPEANIVVRPNPKESWGALAELIGPRPNVIVTRSGTTAEWLRASLMMVHGGSTTSLEATIGGRRSIAYIPEGLNMELFTNQFGPRASSIPDLLKAIEMAFRDRAKNTSETEASSTVLDPAIAARISTPEGQMSATLIADVWDRLSVQHNLRTTSLTLPLWRSERQRRLRALAQNLKNGLHPPRTSQQEGRSSSHGEIAQIVRDESVRFPALDEKRVLDDINQMAEALNIRHIRGKLIHPRLFLISPAR